MKNIEILKKKYRNKFASILEKSDISNDKKSLSCSIIAEIWAYFERTIPEDFLKCNLFDIHGITEDEKSLDINILIKAKNVLCEYCWGVEWQKIDNIYKSDEEKIKNFIWNNSVIPKRIKNGDNLIIFGDSNSPIGKTLFASIVMKEAIKLRRKSFFRGQTYEWVDISILQHALLNEKEKGEIEDYHTCDWLVVDNINRMDFASIKQREYITGLFNPFFIERYENKLPTILTFCFDIENNIDLQKAVGSGIARMIKGKRSFKIRLSPKLDSDSE